MLDYFVSTVEQGCYSSCSRSVLTFMVNHRMINTYTELCGFFFALQKLQVWPYIKYFFCIYALIIPVRYYGTRDSMRTEKKLVYFECVNVSFAAHQKNHPCWEAL